MTKEAAVLFKVGYRLVGTFRHALRVTHSVAAKSTAAYPSEGSVCLVRVGRARIRKFADAGRVHNEYVSFRVDPRTFSTARDLVDHVGVFVDDEFVAAFLVMRTWQRIVF